MKRKVSIMMIVVGLVLVLVGTLYSSYSDGVVNEKWLINTPYIKVDILNGTDITEDMIGYKKIPESEYDELKDNIYVYSVDIIHKCAGKDLKQGDYFYIKDLQLCEVEQVGDNELENDN